MKKALILLAALTTIGITLPSQAEAGHSCNQRIVSYTRCGQPIYAVYQIIGYDRCGNPVGQWVTQNRSCGCNTCSGRHSHSGFRGSSFGGNSCGPIRSSGFTFRFGR